MSSIPFVRFISIYLIFLLNHKFKFCIQQYIPVLLKILKYRNWCLITKCFFSICGKNSKIYSCKSINTLSYICCSVAKSCPTLCDLTGCNTWDFPFFTDSWNLLKTHHWRSSLWECLLALCFTHVVVSFFLMVAGSPVNDCTLQSI